MILALAALAVVATACGKSIETGTQNNFDSSSGTPTAAGSTPAAPSAKLVHEQPANCKVEATKDLKTKPKITIPDCTPSTDLIAIDLVVGSGTELKGGESATINYVGNSFSTKEEFDTSWGGQPFTTTIPGQLIDGWNEAIPGMKVGGRRLLIIPPSKGYGAQGAGDKIGPNETLVFVVDLMDVK